MTKDIYSYLTFVFYFSVYKEKKLFSKTVILNKWAEYGQMEKVLIVYVENNLL